ncbi:uncharacterized protein [Henckelia pumila]|uniref:uncharacterized protein n=1 Tax=Henckelia pumila TaxID=405737 RepID=UPI003C6E19AA
MSSIRNPLSAILDKHVLTGPNYLNWLRNLKIFLNSKRIEYTLEKPPPFEAPTGCSLVEKFKDWCDHDMISKCYMQTSMSDELQRIFEDPKNAADIHMHLKNFFGEQTRSIRHATFKNLITLCVRDRASVHEHGLTLIGILDKIVGMDIVFPAELTTDVLLLSLPSSFDSFVVNFNMNKMDPSLEELVNMLVTYESAIKKENPTLYVGYSYGSNNRPLEKKKKRSTHTSKKNVPLTASSKSRTMATTPVKTDKTSDVCHYCKKLGH